MADTTSKKRKLPPEWYQNILLGMPGVEIHDSAKRALASKFSKFPAHQLGDSALKDVVSILPDAITDATTREIVAMHVKHHIRQELQHAPDPWSVNDILFLAHVPKCFPDRLS